jgi:hypothetical protein
MVTNRSDTDLAIQRRRAAIGSALFMALGPGTVAGLVPYLLTGWRPRCGAQALCATTFPESAASLSVA